MIGEMHGSNLELHLAQPFGLFPSISPSNKSNESISDNLGIEGVLESVPHLPWWCIDDIPCTCP